MVQFLGPETAKMVDRSFMGVVIIVIEFSITRRLLWFGTGFPLWCEEKTNSSKRLIGDKPNEQTDEQTDKQPNEQTEEQMYQMYQKYV